MALTLANAQALSNNQLIAGVIEELIERDETYAMLPFVRVNGKAYVYDREDTASMATASFISPVTDTVPENAQGFTAITATLKVLAGDVDVDNFLNETMNDTNDQKAIQIAAKAKALGRKFKQTFAAGDVTVDTKSFDGLGRLVTAGQTITSGANGAALTLGMLDQLTDQVINGADAIVMRPGTIRAYRNLLYTTGGGTAASMIEIPNFGVPVLAHNGIPILRNDYLPGNETQGTAVGICCSVYALRFNEVDGIHGLYGGPDAGIRFEDIGTVQNMDARRSRLKWYCGLALKSTQSLARLKGITNI